MRLTQSKDPEESNLTPIPSGPRETPNPAFGDNLKRMIPNQTLLFDADDTLWENNIYFERAIAAFISYLDHTVHTPAEVREHLNHCERATTAKLGYGLKSFRVSLIRCFEELTHSPVTSDKHDRIVAFANSIAEQEIELLPHVAETLATLAQRHRLIVVTKGDLAEQTEKLRRSGLAPTSLK